jgi:hypothetical protein
MSEEPHAPKRRNWLVRIVKSRDFTRDIIVTTLGVLIALGIGAIVDEIRWRMRLAASERMMTEELSLVRGMFAERRIVHQCIVDKLQSLDEVLRDARKSGRFPSLKQIGGTPDHGDFGDSWNLMQSGDVLLHMDPTKAMEHASTWVNVKAVTTAVADQRTAFEALSAYWDRPGPGSEAVIEEAMRQVQLAFNAEERLIYLAIRTDERLEKAGVPRLTPRREKFVVAPFRKELLTMRVCLPLLVDEKPHRIRDRVPLLPLPKDLVG